MLLSHIGFGGSHFLVDAPQKCGNLVMVGNWMIVFASLVTGFAPYSF